MLSAYLFLFLSIPVSLIHSFLPYILSLFSSILSLSLSPYHPPHLFSSFSHIIGNICFDSFKMP